MKPSINAGGANPTQPTEFKFLKKINTRMTTNGKTPGDTALKFTVGDVQTTAEVPEGTNLTVSIENTVFAAGETQKELTIKLPAYPVVGVYEYDITEENSNYEGMTYATGLKLKVTVVSKLDENKQPTGALEIAGIALRQTNSAGEEVKVGEFENEYAAGDLKVTKKVAGNLGDTTKPFPITINLTSTRTVNSEVTYKVNGGEAQTVTWNGTSATVSVNLKHNDYVEVFNLPEGVTYTVVEDAAIKHEATAAEGKFDNEPNTYAVTGEKTDTQDVKATETADVTITNTKGFEPDTGIVLDTLPYVLMMMLAMVGFMMTARKREEY